MILVSPAEPKELRSLGVTSSECEARGCDFLIVTPNGIISVQRKEIADLISSIRGDRIARERGQLLAQDGQPIFIIEGDWDWGPRHGRSRSTLSEFTRSQYLGVVLSLQEDGFWVIETGSLKETAEVIPRIEAWLSKDHHGSLAWRPKSRGLWGTARNREWGIHILQSFDGIGVGTAGEIYDHFGTVPLAWTMDWDQVKVAGVAKIRAKKLKEALPNGTVQQGMGSDAGGSAGVLGV